MTSTSALTGASLGTFQSLMNDPPTAAVDWNSVRDLLGQLGDLAVEPNGNLILTRHGQILVLHPAQTRSIGESGEVMALRRFLQQSDALPVHSAGRDPHLLVVIHQRNASVFRCQVVGGVPQLILRFDFDAHTFDIHATKPAMSAKPAHPKDAFVVVAEALQSAGQIVIFGTSGSGEIDEFIAALVRHDPTLQDRIVGTMHIDERQLSEAELLTAARAFYAPRNTPAPVATIGHQGW